MKDKADVGIIGLGVMGSNLALNIEEKGYQVAVYNKEPEIIDSFMKSQKVANKKFVASKNYEDLVSKLSSPKKIIIMVTAGEPVDQVILSLLPFLNIGDSIIDCGNSHYQDTNRRFNSLKQKGILFLGVGVSGGAEGARNGPSLMAGGSKKAYDLWEDLLHAISAKAGKMPCCAYFGKGGMGHFIKMVHNGVEYADMQLICEAYHIMRDVLYLSNKKMSDIYSRWNMRKLSGYLMDITSKILSFRDGDGSYLIDKIDDVVEQKGTGKWLVKTALDEGASLTVISAAVFSRNLSTQKNKRNMAAHLFHESSVHFDAKKANSTIDILEKSLYLSKIVAYAEAFDLIMEFGQKQGIHIPIATVAAIWQNGCIIRSEFLPELVNVYKKNPKIPNLLFDSAMKTEVADNMESLRKISILSIEQNIPLPCHLAALSYLDSLSADRLPTNLLAAQRDYFGGHMYHRIGEDFPIHTNWNIV